MKRLFEWWHSYRLIVMTLKGVTALLNNSKYNKKLNLAFAVRGYEWCVDTYPYTNLGPFDKLVVWKVRRVEKKLNSFNFAGFKYTDGWDDAMTIANNLDGDVAAQVLNEAWTRMRAAQEGHVHDDHDHEHTDDTQSIHEGFAQEKSDG